MARPASGAVGRPGTAPQPNELDRRRIEKAITRRSRYRYVHPAVHWEPDGYRISSPCCSRNIDVQGGVIDIARFEYVGATGSWHLYSRDHAGRRWVLQASGRLLDLIELLNRDPVRTFWQ